MEDKKWDQDGYPRVLYYLVGLTLVFLFFACLLKFASPIQKDFFFLGNSIFLITAGFLIIYDKKRVPLRGMSFRTRIALAFFFITLAFNQIIILSPNFSLLSINSLKENTAHITSCICWTLGITAVLSSTEKSLKSYLQLPLISLSLIITTPVLWAVAWKLFIAQMHPSIWEGISLFLSFLMLEISFITLWSAQSLLWSIFSAGMVCLIFANYSVRAGSSGEAQYYFSYLFGTWAAILAIFKQHGHSKIENIDHSSIFAEFKMWTTTILFLGLVYFTLVEKTDLSGIKSICVISPVSSMLTVVLAYIITHKITSSSRWAGSILVGSSGKELINPEATSDFPLELREIHQAALAKVFQEQRALEKEREFERKIEIQKQIAHDIRSPLTALNIIKSDHDLSRLPETKRVILRSAINRVNDIISNLHKMGSDSNEQGLKQVFIPSLLDEIISEKRLKTASPSIYIELDHSSLSYGIFCRAEEVELKRAISNLIENAIEAVEGSGQIKVTLNQEGKYAVICIFDNGKGIPENIANKIGIPGFTYGKVKGQGLGTSHAKKSIESWGGSISFVSEAEKGTQVKIFLPKQECPAWFVDHLLIEPSLQVVVLDDDPSIHQIWKNRFRQVGFDKVKHFSVPAEFLNWIKSQLCSNFIFLVDYEFFQNELTGIDLVKELNLIERSILVSSHFDDPIFRNRCINLGIRIIPKNFAFFIPITVQKSISEITPYSFLRS